MFDELRSERAGIHSVTRTQWLHGQEEEDRAVSQSQRLNGHVIGTKTKHKFSITIFRQLSGVNHSWMGRRILPYSYKKGAVAQW